MFDHPSKKLLQVIHETHAVKPSLNLLSAWADMDYHTAHRYLDFLERNNMVVVLNRGMNRKDGCQLVILPCSGSEI